MRAPSLAEAGLARESLGGEGESGGAFERPPRKPGYSRTPLFQGWESQLLTADAEALEDSAIWWSRGDLAIALEDHGIDPDDELIDDLAKRLDNMRDWRDEVYNLGKRTITEAVIDLLHDTETDGKAL